MTPHNHDELNTRIAFLLEYFRSRLEDRLQDNFEKMLTVESVTEKKMLLASIASLQSVLGDVEEIFEARE